MKSSDGLRNRLAAVEALLPVRDHPGPSPAPRWDHADQVSLLVQQVMAEARPGALVLDWQLAPRGVVAGRMAADGLLYRFRCDADVVAFRPAWDGVNERSWEIRSDSFLQLRAPEQRLDFRGGAVRARKKCGVGYSCGSTCISVRKECLVRPGSAIGKGRLKRLLALAAGGDKAAAGAAQRVTAGRGSKAAELRQGRNVKRLEALLQRPEIAEMVRTGKVPESKPKAGAVRDLSPDEIEFDPARFQYKIKATATTGEVGSLSGVKKWDPNLAGVISVWQDADGKTYVVNGHNRLALARRLGAEAVTVRYLDAPTAKDARAIGAMQNIAEGAGTPMDAAKFFRDTGIQTPADVEARGLPLNSGQADKGLRLSKLPDDVFKAVVDGDLSINRGAIIGGSGLEAGKQQEIFKMVSSRRGITNKTLSELVDHARISEQQTQTTFDLFGSSEVSKSNLITRAKLSAGLKSKISREKRLFGTVSKARSAASLTEKAGNVINQEASSRVAAEAGQALQVFEQLKSTAGPISTALNRAADRVEAGEPESEVRKELESDVFAAVEFELEAVGLRPRKSAFDRADGDSADYYRNNPEAREKKNALQRKINRRPERKKYRARLWTERRRRGMAGQGGPDLSHTEDDRLIKEDPKANRARNGHDGRSTKRADSLQERIDRAKAKAPPGQMGLFGAAGGGNDIPCGASHISRAKTCRITSGAPAAPAPAVKAEKAAATTAPPPSPLQLPAPPAPG